jgi:hypothetical protein
MENTNQILNERGFITLEYKRQKGYQLGFLNEIELEKALVEQPLYKALATIIDADLIDYVDLNEEICLIVDEEGLLKSGNLVYEIRFEGHTHHIAGKFAIGRNEESMEGLKTVTLLVSDYEKLQSLTWSVVGQVR